MVRGGPVVNQALIFLPGISHFVTGGQCSTCVIAGGGGGGGGGGGEEGGRRRRGGRRAGGEKGKGERGGSKRRGRKRQTWNLVHTTQMKQALYQV